MLMGLTMTMYTTVCFVALNIQHSIAGIKLNPLKEIPAFKYEAFYT